MSKAVNESQKSPLAASVLNRLLQTLCRSLPLYVDEIRPWSLASHEPVWTAIGRLAADSRRLAQRVAEAIIAAGGQPSPGAYPPAFARLNDVGLEFFLGEIITALKRDQKVIQRCIEELPRDPAAQALAEEAHGNIQGHIELLEKLVQ